MRQSALPGRHLLLELRLWPSGWPRRRQLGLIWLPCGLRLYRILRSISDTTIVDIWSQTLGTAWR